jgi:hypothetical protein
MHRVRLVHPSAAIFVGILIALFLPFGHAVAGCGSEQAEFTGIDLVLSDVEPMPSEEGGPITAADRDFADQVETNTLLPTALLLAAALTGLLLAVFVRGKLWGTCCAVAMVATLAIGLLANFDDAHAGWHLAFWLPAGGVAARIFLAVARRFGAGAPEAAAG